MVEGSLMKHYEEMAVCTIKYMVAAGNLKVKSCVYCTFI